MWVLPTYNRPEQCAKVIEQINNVGCSTPGVLFINGSECLAEYQKIQIPTTWRWYWSEENIGVCAAMNKMFELCPDEAFYGLICDDEYVFMPGWDHILKDAAGKWKISHGNDFWQSHNRIHSYVTVGGDLVRECGWWALPGLWHWYHDDVQELLAKECDLRVFCKHVLTEHRHYLAGKATKDSTYEAGESKNSADAAIFHEWKNNYSQELIKRIKEKMPLVQNCYSFVEENSE